MEDYTNSTCGLCLYLDRNTTKEGIIFTKYWCKGFGVWKSRDNSACSAYVRDPACFLTTACVNYKGLPDDCVELTTLRLFRDNHMKKSEEGRILVEEYYRIAPSIVEKINNREDKDKIYDYIYNNVLLCVELIENKKFEETQNTYISLVKSINDMVNN